MSKKMMKRSLALGALMAFVITGSAMAQYQELEGVNGIVTGNEFSSRAESFQGNAGERVLGGYTMNGSVEEQHKAEINSVMTVKAGKFNYIVGGHYARNLSNQVELNVNSTNVVIEDGMAKLVVGGTAGFNNKELTHVRDSSTLVINDGDFGTNSTKGNTWDNTNVPELVVVGGDYFKADNSGTSGGTVGADYSASSNINTTNITINGGNFNSAIIGGSAAIQYYSAANNVTADVHVENVNIAINDGIFNHAIIAGGLAHGTGSESTVGNVTMNILGGTMNDNIYAGGVVSSKSYSPVATVSSATINISDTVINSIYGTGAEMINDATGNEGNWRYVKDTSESAIVNTTLKLTNVNAETVDVQKGSVTLSTTDTNTTKIDTLKTGADVKVSMIADGTATDKLNGNAEAFRKNIILTNVNEGFDYTAVEGKMNAGDIVGDVTFQLDAEGNVIKDSVKEEVHEGNAGVAHNANIALMAWRAETNDMNKRMGELRNAKGEHGVWTRMVGGEDEFENAKYEYTQYQLGYDEKLSVDPSWTVGVALSYTDGESNFGKGSGENTHKGLSVYGSKLNEDGSFIDLIAKYSRLEHDLTVENEKGDYSTNGYSVSAEYGKRIQQGNGLWIEPQVELTYGKVKDAEYKLGSKTVSQDAMESLVGRIGFSLGKDIKQGNVYARASYLYDFEGETNMAFTNDATRNFEYDLGGGWFEVGVGANINLSKATYIYADVEKTFGGEVDTNWQWNLGVRYSF